jgi:hypothetical protein
MMIDNRLHRAQKTVSKMITLYCHAHHKPYHTSLCLDCLDLAAYAHRRIERCPYGADKPPCAKCPIHCYQADRREQIRQVMRFAGPRMLLHHPRLAILHLVDGLHKPPTR